MGKIIAIFNRKGGVAKTTSTYNLAALSAMKGYKTLMIDLDSQASLTISTRSDPEEFDYNIAALLKDGIDKTKDLDVYNAIYQIEQIDNLYLIPSHTELTFLERNMDNVSCKEYILRDILEKVSLDFDYIFIDCAPALGHLNMNALTASEYVLIPAEPDDLAYKAITELISIIEDIKKLTNSRLKILGIVLTRFEGHTTHAKNVKKRIEKEIPYKILGTIKKSVTIKSGLGAGMPLVSIPESKIAREIKEEYQKVFNYIENIEEDHNERG